MVGQLGGASGSICRSKLKEYVFVDLSRSVPIFCGCFLGLVPTGAEGEASMFYRATKAEASESGSEARLRVRLVGHRKREDLFGCVPNQVTPCFTHCLNGVVRMK